MKVAVTRLACEMTEEVTDRLSIADLEGECVAGVVLDAGRHE
jgi:hypothetical protein